jgi:hypothetical protein
MSSHNTSEKLLEYLEKDVSLRDSLLLYSEKRFKRNQQFTEIQVQRKKEFIDFIENYASQRFTSEMVYELVTGLENNFCVSTAGHHWPIGHPFFFHATILRSMSTKAPIINLNISQISLWNSSYPRWLVFHGNKRWESYLHIPFLGGKNRMSPVYGTPWFTIKDIEQNALSRISQYRKNQLINDAEYITLHTFLEKNLLNNKLLLGRKYSEQITLLNYIWWSELFKNELESVFELDVEEIVSSIIQKLLFLKNPISEILCSINIQTSIEKKFNNVDCCFSLENHSGTYLFWHLDKKWKRWGMWRDDKKLKSSDKLFTVEMTPECLATNLREGLIIPSGMLIYIVIVWYFWLASFWWIFQSNYLKKIIQAYWELFPEEIFLHEKLDMSTICADMYFIFSQENFPVTALDMVINKNNIQYMKDLTVLESIKNSFIDL